MQSCRWAQGHHARPAFQPEAERMVCCARLHDQTRSFAQKIAQKAPLHPTSGTVFQLEVLKPRCRQLQEIKFFRAFVPQLCSRKTKSRRRHSSEALPAHAEAEIGVWQRRDKQCAHNQALAIQARAIDQVDSCIELARFLQFLFFVVYGIVL